MTDNDDRRTRISWITLSTQAVLVVISVLLALALNSWREGRAEHRLAVRALQDLVAEATLNCSLIRSIGDYHERVASRQQPPEGIRIGLLTNDAWQSAQSTGAAAYVDYQVAAVAGRVYANQRDHRDIVQSYAQALFIALATGTTLADEMHGDLDVAAIREMIRIQHRLTELYGELRTVLADHYEEVAADPMCPAG